MGIKFSIICENNQKTDSVKSLRMRQSKMGKSNQLGEFIQKVGTPEQKAAYEQMERERVYSIFEKKSNDPFNVSKNQIDIYFGISPAKQPSIYDNFSKKKPEPEPSPKAGNDNHTKKETTKSSQSNQGLMYAPVLTRELINKKSDIKRVPLDSVPKQSKKTPSVKKDKILSNTIQTGGLTWAEIVKSYYPGLVEKCNGRLYGKDGAIRKLKNALCACDGRSLINETDIPKTLNLPAELEGIKVNMDAEPKRIKITKTGGHTDIKESGCKNIE